MTRLDLNEPVYLYHFFNYNLITHELKQIVVLRNQLLEAAQQELLRKRIQEELDVDMGTRQKISLELHEVVNSLKEKKNEKRDEEVHVYMANTVYEPLSPIPEELTPPSSDNEGELSTSENDDPQESNNTPQ
ncbi:hypothetical protein C2G38_2044576 [Gigaspora rosea]|uniref:Uncharacterized protein n=1 Tax=Gigaspora rosea TaxID=44941 RepID=A0A397UG22_9GLOM|nr:hypothetical protein C2G38_2044576 [Gigaspora rosea]